MMKARLWPRASIATDELELRPFTAHDIQPFVRSIDDEVRYWQGFDHNMRAIRQIEAVGATPVEEGRHTLPNGTVIDARWYHHVAD
jgi:hypothetical protein